MSTSRQLSASRAWGKALDRLQGEGHELVATTGRPPSIGLGPPGSPRQVPDNIRSLVADRPPVAPDAVKSFALYRASPSYAQTHSMLLVMLSRVDSTGTFRSLEREVLVRKMHLEIFSALAETKPTIGIFDVTPHEAMDFALMRVLEWQGVPILMFQPSLVGPQVMARTSLTETLPLELDSRVVQRYRDALEKVHRIADESIERLARGTGTPKMDNQRAKEATVGTLSARFSALRYSLKRLRTPSRDVAFAFTGHSDVFPAIRRVLELLFERSLRRSLKRKIEQLPSLSDAPRYRFALFALHYEPERSSIPEGFPFDSQLDAIVAVRHMLPDEVTLCVKEHFSQKTSALRGFVGRSPDFYDLLDKIPGVEVLGIETNTRALIRSAECVMTFTGKVGIEAALEGSRVLYLGQPWWVQMPGAHNFHELQSYEELLTAPVPDPAEVKAWLTQQIRTALLPGVSSVPPERHSKRIAQLPAGFDAVEAEGILTAVRAVMRQSSGASQKA